MNTENHYQETDLGNISLNPRGEYNPEESYEYLDLVVLEGGSYVCLAENGATITGISPESGKTTQYWQVITIPGSLTPEYIAMHDRVVNLSEQVGADAVEVRTAEQNVSGMELNVTQMQEQTRQSAEAAEQSKDSSAGYAASADSSRQAAEESEQNVNAQVTGFDSHVAEKTEEAENDIEAARIAANKAIIAQQEQSVNEVARAGIEAISTAQSAAQTATEKAQAADTSEKNAAASETAAKLSEANATKMAEQVATDKEQVANDRTAVENAKQEMTESSAQIEKNTQGIADLKSDLGAIESAFDEGVVNLILSNYTTGSYIDINGTIKENAAVKYASVSIDIDLIGKPIYVSGYAWWEIMPFVFVDQNNNTTYADVPDPAGTPTQHMDIEFKPTKAGTLYINVYASGSNVQQGGAYYKNLSNLKSDYLPDVADFLDDTTEYNIVNIGSLIESKLLNGNTGAITNDGQTTYRVSDYIAVESDTYYLISTEHFWSMGLYAFYDENKTYISGRNSNSGGTVTQIYNEKVKSPKNAAYLVIGFLYQPNYTAPWLFKGIKNSILPSKKWQNKKWACVGDSLTESYGVTSMHYFEYISAATGIKTVNLGISGTGYARGSDNFMTRALTVPTDSDVITFFGSGNDSGAGLELGTASDTGTTTLGGCINTAIDNLYSIMPLAQLGIVTPTPWQGNMPLNNGWMERYSNLIVEICKRRSIPCLDLFHCSGLNPNDANVRTLAYSKDNGGGIHPDETGHKIIAQKFKAFLESLIL